MCGGASPEPAPVMPAVDNAAVMAALKKEQDLARLRKGRQSTILTPMTEDQGTTTGGKKTLLGG